LKNMTARTRPARTPAPRILSVRDLAQIAIFAALIAALGLPGALSIGAVAVPITFQTLGVMLAGAILGARKGFFAVLLLLALAAAGLPLLSGGRGGIVWFTTSPSAGYLYGWLLGALVIGYLTGLLLPRYRLWAALGATALGGVVVVYLIGVPVTAINLGLPIWVALVDAAKFLPGDLVKVVVTVLVARQVHKAYPGLIPPRRRAPGAGLSDTVSAGAVTAAS
jgi:biotin transport system substrate-specific component